MMGCGYCYRKVGFIEINFWGGITPTDIGLWRQFLLKFSYPVNSAELYLLFVLVYIAAVYHEASDFARGQYQLTRPAISSLQRHCSIIIDSPNPP